MKAPFSLIAPLWLASQSPRRQQLLSDLGFPFTVHVRPTAEQFPAQMPAQQVAAFLAQQKMQAFKHELSRPDSPIIITADTVVVAGDKLLNKPQNAGEALQMLSLLNGQSHHVYTGLSIAYKAQLYSCTEKTTVVFKSLEKAELAHYVTEYKPYDKAGAYGIQEWIGMVAIEALHGDYYNVMGLPVHQVYQLLKHFKH